ncbi:DUF1492 domain-containing protein [Streptococcus danieliae]|uniref:DUF1492 domain-containing protein n=1 Tax=Streptococcus danieliae TaxID=747656 RepID=A0A7X3G8P2_9STRE|nr:DUF1492 domain-containing protein [Streptococcus danieliae]
MDKELKKLTIKKLKELRRWLMVVGLTLNDLRISEAFKVELIAFESEQLERLKGFRKQAPEEINEIIQAINKLPHKRHRATLIMAYLELNRQPIPQQLKRLNISETNYYLYKNQALEDFSEVYRSGWLIEYRQRQRVTDWLEIATYGQTWQAKA